MPYAIAKYSIIPGKNTNQVKLPPTLVLSGLNAKVVSANQIKTSNQLLESIKKNADNPQLFTKSAIYLRTGN